MRRSIGNDATRANASPYSVLTKLWLSATTCEPPSDVYRDCYTAQLCGGLWITQTVKGSAAADSSVAQVAHNLFSIAMAGLYFSEALLDWK